MSSQLCDIMGSTDFKVDWASYMCGSNRNSNYLVSKPYKTSLKLLKIKKIQVLHGKRLLQQPRFYDSKY